MGAVLLQSGFTRAGWTYAQKPTGFHRHESDRLEPGASDIGGEHFIMIIDKKLSFANFI